MRHRTKARKMVRQVLELAQTWMLFRNPIAYRRALRRKSDETMVVRAWRGPDLEIRQNI